LVNVRFKSRPNWHSTCKHNVEDDPEGVSVRQLPIECLVLGHLWILVLRYTPNHLQLIVLLEAGCKSKVYKLYFVILFVHDDVLNPEVSVHETKSMHVVDGAHNLSEDVLGSAFAQIIRVVDVLADFAFLTMAF
jgi:hypothetical protein